MRSIARALSSAAGSRRPGLRLALVAVVALATLPSTSGIASAHSRAQAKIVAPRAVRAPRRARFAVRVSAPAQRVAFFVDGRRRWVTHADRRPFSRRGRLRTARLAPGRHRLRIRGRLSNGRIVHARRVLYVGGSAKTTREHGHKTREPATEPTPTESTSTSAGVLFNGDFENGFAGWYIQSLPERISLVSSGVYQGAQAARFEVREGDVEPQTGSQRSEVSGPTFNEGEDLYINDAFRISGANTFSTPWQIIQQLHEENWSGSPGLAVFLDSSNALKLGSGDSSLTFWKSPALERGRWYDLTYRVNLSQSSSIGFVEVWLDGVQQTLANGLTRAYGRTMQTSQTYLKAGIYRSKSSTGTSIIEHDAIVVASSLGVAEAG